MRFMKCQSTLILCFLLPLVLGLSVQSSALGQAQEITAKIVSEVTDIPAIEASMLDEARSAGLWQLEEDGLKLITRSRDSDPFFVFSKTVGYNEQIHAQLLRHSKSRIHFFFRSSFPDDLSQVSGYSLLISNRTARIVRWDEGVSKNLGKSQNSKNWPKALTLSIILDGPRIVAEINDARDHSRIATFIVNDATYDGPNIGLQFGSSQRKNTALQGLALLPSPKGNEHPIYGRDAYLSESSKVYVVSTDAHAKDYAPLDACRLYDADFIPGHKIYRCDNEDILNMLDDKRMLPEPMRFVQSAYAMRANDYRKASLGLNCKRPMHCDLSQPIDPNKSSKDAEMTLAYLEAYLPQCQKNVKNVRLETIGHSYLGYPIKALVLSNVDDGKARPRIMFNGAHHGLELLSTDFVFDIIESLCENPQDKGAYKTYLDAFEIWAIPMVNPDGTDLYFHSSLGYGRKNGRSVFKDDGVSKGDAYLPAKVGNPAPYSAYMRTRPNNMRPKQGVDLNRNYPLLWGSQKSASSDKPTHNWYRGASPGSEPETQAMMTLSLSEAFMSSITFHTVSNKILVPYSIDSLENPPREDDYLWKIGEAMSLAAGVQKKDKPYEVVKNIYSVDGTDQDYFRFVTGSFAYLIEGAFHNPRGDKRREAIAKSRPAWEKLLELSTSNHIIKVSSSAGEPLIADLAFSDLPQLNGERWMTRCNDGSLAQICEPGTTRQITATLYNGKSQSQTVKCLEGQSQVVSFTFAKPKDYTISKAICRDSDTICASLYGPDALCEMRNNRCPNIKASQNYCLINNHCVKADQSAHGITCRPRENNRMHKK